MSHGLNPPQLEAVKTLRGPMLVLAGAGTGKTRVVTHRIAELIRHGTRPERILAVTFTRKAAGEMLERATELLFKGKRKPANSRQKAKDDLPPQPEISTFHSLCVRVLRRHASLLGYPAHFGICDRNEQESHARAALREVRCPSALLSPGDLLAAIGRWKNFATDPAGAARVAETDRDHLAAAAYRRYQNSLKGAGVVDFDDLLLLTEQLLRQHAAACAAEQRRFDHVLIDEYQDTNQSQYQIVRALAVGHRNLCVVGDDDQSIYAWRGAEVAHILRFQKDWPDAKVVRLEANYRSTSAILNYANTLIRFNAERHEKQLNAARHDGNRPRILQFKDETDEAKQVVADISRQLAMGRPASEFAILFRTNEQPRAFETELRAAGVPYVLIGGMSFFDRREVRDVLSFLKIAAVSDDDASLLRVLNTPPRGLGDAARKALVADATVHGEPLWRTLCEPTRVGSLTDAALRGAISLRDHIRSWHAKLEHQPLAEVLRSIVADIRYRDEIARLYEEPTDREPRWAAVEEVINAAASFDAGRGRKIAPRQRVMSFLDDLLLSGRDNDRDKESQLSRNAVALMTLHSAKGLEFPRVYMVGLEEGILPHKRSLEGGEKDIAEERRLCYVGVTRAQDELTLTFALTRMKWGKPRETQPSRFLYEMTGQAEKVANRRTDGARTKQSAPVKRRPATKGAKANPTPVRKKRPS